MAIMAVKVESRSETPSSSVVVSERKHLLQKPVWTVKEPHSVHKLHKGDHIWCHAKGYGKAIQHHGIWDGTGVYHFDKEFDDTQDDIDKHYVYNNCQCCEARRLKLEKAGLAGRGVRFNCINCYSHGNNVYRCEYEAPLLGLVWRETGSRSMQVCKQSGEEVVAVAKYLYDTELFGRYDVKSSNCEDFARFCKIGKLGSKQVIRAEVVTGILEVSVGGLLGAVAVLGAHNCLKRMREAHEHELVNARSRFAYENTSFDKTEAKSWSSIF